jgi:hypothetical protein
VYISDFPKARSWLWNAGGDDGEEDEAALAGDFIAESSWKKVNQENAAQQSLSCRKIMICCRALHSPAVFVTGHVGWDNFVKENDGVHWPRYYRCETRTI